MQAVTIIGLDIAKSMFQVHGVDAEGKHERRRLAEIKRRYDPDNLFRMNQNILPAS